MKQYLPVPIANTYYLFYPPAIVPTFKFDRTCLRYAPKTVSNHTPHPITLSQLVIALRDEIPQRHNNNSILSMPARSLAVVSAPR